MSNDDLFDTVERAAACCEDAGAIVIWPSTPNTVVKPRRNPDQLVADEVHQIDFAIDRLRDAVRRGGSFRIPGVINGLRFKLSEIPEHVLSREEAEAI